jgi:hypothetical protein
MKPPDPPLPTPMYLPFQPLVGSHTSNSMCESAVGHMKPSTRQNSGTEANCVGRVGIASGGWRGTNIPARTIVDAVMVVDSTRTDLTLSHVAADAVVASIEALNAAPST